MNIATVRRQLAFIATGRPHTELSRWDVLLKCLASVEALATGAERDTLRAELQTHLVFQSDVDMADVDAIVQEKEAEMYRLLRYQDPWAKGDPFAMYDEETEDESNEGLRGLPAHEYRPDKSTDANESGSLFPPMR